MKVGITGGIGSGKSYICKRLEARGIMVYDCDSAAKRLISTNPEIRQQLTELIGPEAYETEENLLADKPHLTYRLNKAVVTHFLLKNAQNAHAIDSIVHPAVFHDFEISGMQWMESAIMYESGIYKLVDRVVVVTAPEEIRIQRIINRDNTTREKALQWMERQWPQQQIKALADYEIINDGFADIDGQIDLLLSRLSQNV
jgi:dephospho-CoA kinase